MKIIIIGAGIGGLTTYHALRKHLSQPSPSSPKVTITVYESHASPTSTTSNIGGGLGLAPNGLRAIASVSQIAADYIQEHGFPGAIFTLRNSDGKLLGRHFAGRPERYGFGMQMIRRAEVHLALLQDIPPGVITYGKKVTSVSETAEGVRVECNDGSSETADLVIGADGVRSAVRQSIFQNKYPAEYNGLTGVGGFLPLSSLPTRLQGALQTEEFVTMTFGRLGFFGYSLCSPKAGHPSDAYIQRWSVYESPTPPPRDHGTFRSDIRDQLLKRHASWKSPYDLADGPRVFESIISLGCGKPGIGSQSDDDGGSSSSIQPPNETLLVLPQYITTRIPQWSTPSGSGKVILLGDAAHAMPPDSGQGVSCATEDAVVLGLLLKEFLEGGQSQGFDVDEAIRQTAKAYEDMRMKRIWRILDITEKIGGSKKDVGWWKERIRDWVIWVACRFPESFNDRLFAYDAEVAVREYLAKGGFKPTSTLQKSM